MKPSEPQYLSALCEVCHAISSVFDLQEVLSLIVKSAVESMKVKAGSLRLLDEEERRLEIVAAYGLSKEYLKKGPVEVEKSPIDREALMGKVVTILDVTKDGRFQYPEEANKEGICSVLCVPLKIRDRAIGVIRVYTSAPHEFTEYETRLLYTLVCHGAIAIENARLRGHIKRDYEDLVRDVWRWYDWGARPPKL